MTEPAPLVEIKRPHSNTMDELPTKKQRIHRSVHHVQQVPPHLEPATQDPAFVQDQLLKSISAALVVAGFDGVNTTTLEMFRSHTEAYMLKFLDYAKTSMQASRRSKATAADFASALSLMPNTATASRVQPQLGLKLPAGVAYPSIRQPDQELGAPPDFSHLLSSLVDTDPKGYIPKHFPLLPPRHAWVETPVFPQREVDSRKMRERATQEGMLAEQALRKLAAAAKAGAMKAERNRSTILRRQGRARDTKREAGREEIFTDLLKDIGALEEAEDAEKNVDIALTSVDVDVGMPEGVVVNYDMGHWRRSSTRRALRIPLVVEGSDPCCNHAARCHGIRYRHIKTLPNGQQPEADNVSGVERTLHTVFKRCVQCPGTTPSCPTCASGEICSLVLQSCDQCAYSMCTADPNPPPPPQKSNVGAIAGGVIGGLAVVAVVVFLVWRFWIKKRRAQQELEAEDWADDDIASQKRSTRFTMQTDAVSTRTRASLATSILSRASNIIQIAYIPGVTNRNGSSHNSVLQAHPVPPIPAALRGPGNGQASPKSPLVNEGDTLFFSPRDLRGSTYSGTSSLGSNGNRDTQYTQFSRQSITPSLARSSIASTIYHNDAAAEPMPAMPAARAIPRMVSVKNSPASTPSAQSPSSESMAPVSVAAHAEFAANINKGKGFQIMMAGQNAQSGSSSPSAASSFVKATKVNVSGSKGKGRFPVVPPTISVSKEANTKHVPGVSSPLVEGGNETSDDEDLEEHARARRSLLNATQQAAYATPPPIQPVESPFFDASETLPAGQPLSSPKLNPYATLASTVGARPDTRTNRGVGGLSAVIEEATRRASSTPGHDGLGGKADEGPFSNEHSTS
nr:protein opy2 [Quercus suber]